ncbi:MAG: translation initiation factor IF-2 N-terminal domain-containing protein, partial [Pseudomonadota bacterium]
MTADNTDARDAGEGRKTTLTLNRTVDTGQVRQSFGKGHTNNVVVQKKRKRTISAPASQPTPTAPSEAKPPVVEVKKPRRQERPAAGGRGRGGDGGRAGEVQTRKLSDAEKDARLRALKAAREREAEEKARAAAEAKQRAEEDARRLQREAEERRAAEEEAKRQAELEAVARAEEEARAADEQSRAAAARKDAGKAERKAPVAEARTEPAAPVEPPINKRAMPDEQGNGPAVLKPFERPKRMLKPEVAKPAAAPKKSEGDRRRGKLTITNALDEEQRERSLASLRRRQERQKKQLMGGGQGQREKIVKEVTIPEVITIQELANRMAERAVDVIKFLMKQGEMHKMNDVIDTDTAELIVEEFGHVPVRVSAAD